MTTHKAHDLHPAEGFSACTRISEPEPRRQAKRHEVDVALHQRNRGRKIPALDVDFWLSGSRGEGAVPRRDIQNQARFFRHQQSQHLIMNEGGSVRAGDD